MKERLTQTQGPDDTVQSTADLQKQVLDEGRKRSLSLATNEDRGGRSQLLRLDVGSVDGGGDGLDLGVQGGGGGGVLGGGGGGVDARGRLVCVKRQRLAGGGSICGRRDLLMMAVCFLTVA